jgi:hypothetical protein
MCHAFFLVEYLYFLSSHLLELSYFDSLIQHLNLNHLLLVRTLDMNMFVKLQHNMLQSYHIHISSTGGC